MPEEQLELVSSPELRLPFCTLDAKVSCCWLLDQQQMLSYRCPDVKVWSSGRENTGCFFGHWTPRHSVELFYLDLNVTCSTASETSAWETKCFHGYYSCSTLFSSETMSECAVS